MRSDSVAFGKHLVATVDKMPAFPRSAQKILQLTREASCSPRDLVSIIDNDPVITVKVLRVVNSAYYSLPKKISSIGHAVVFLGFNTIKNLSLSLAAMGMLPKSRKAGFDAPAFLLHSLSAAAVARRLSNRLPGADPHEFFIAGLLHDFGKVVIAHALPEEFGQALEYGLWHEVSLHQGLMEVVGVDQALVGALLLESWQFPANLVEAIRFQHQVENCEVPMADVIFAANQICKHMGLDFCTSPTAVELPACVAHRLGGTLTRIIEDMSDLQAILDDARRFANV
jgi:HD-like signal output (HDOD) protein